MKIDNKRSLLYFRLLSLFWNRFLDYEKLPARCADDLLFEYQKGKLALTRWQLSTIERFVSLWDKHNAGILTPGDRAYILSITQGFFSKLTPVQVHFVLTLGSGRRAASVFDQKQRQTDANNDLNIIIGHGNKNGKGYANYKRRIRNFGCQCGFRFNGYAYGDCNCESPFTWQCHEEAKKIAKGIKRKQKRLPKVSF